MRRLSIEGLIESMKGMHKTKRNPERIDRILELVGKYWKKNPDLRLGQLLSNITMGEDNLNTDIYFYEDSQLLKSLVELTGKNKETLNEKHSRISKEARR